MAVPKNADKQKKVQNAAAQKRAAQKKGIRKAAGSRKGGNKPAPLPTDPKKAKRELRRRRKMHKPHGELAIKLCAAFYGKPLGDMARKEQCAKVASLMPLVKGHVTDLALKHDSGRVVQAMFKFGSGPQRDELLKEIKGHEITLAKHSVGRRVFESMLRHCNNAAKQTLFEAFCGHWRELSSHRLASRPADMVFRVCANADQQRRVVQELASAELAKFPMRNADGSFLSLQQVVEKDPAKRSSLSTQVDAFLGKMLDKEVAALSLVHRLLRDFVDAAEGDARQRVVDAVCNTPLQILQTREGAEALCRALPFASAKGRKQLIRGVKEHVHEIAEDQDASYFVMRLLQLVDDTVLLKKQVVTPLLNNMSELTERPLTTAVLLNILKPRQQRYIGQAALRLLPEPVTQRMVDAGEAEGPAHCKKDVETRRRELLQKVLPSLLEHYTSLDGEGMTTVLSEGASHLAHLLCETVSAAAELDALTEEQATTLAQSVAAACLSQVRDERMSDDEEEASSKLLLAVPARQRLVKALLRTPLCLHLAPLLTETLLLPESLQNKPQCFLLLSILESEHADASLQKSLKKSLKKLREHIVVDALKNALSKKNK